ncbi:helix-turn-helix domain-containing protein [Erythrobacter tepidarius]|uniref:helix-turn-helix domain-containing protein n=1 Tax=Erythrobacter tepidarius TaxID=60454 RepID=UPI000A38ED1F|nr:helix-turn-helix domain-containing protein [Erythrobacter tepidarius]
MRAVFGKSVNLRFALPSEPLRPFVTTYYYIEAACSPHEPWLEDYLHPEWANLRFLSRTEAHSVIGTGEPLPCPAFAVTGPTSRAARFRLRSGRIWGIGLMPSGWAALFPAKAGDYADRIVDGMADPAFARLVPLALALARSDGDYAAELALIGQHMDALFAAAQPVDPAIEALTAALIDPDLISVVDLAERLGMNVRSLERLSHRAFGFPPKLLLRRQRFLRSLARFMLDPSLKWIGTLDAHYHDQSHFVRDFRRFMGMSPSAYADLDKPLLVAAARARMAVAGQAVQGLHRPAS